MAPVVDWTAGFRATSIQNVCLVVTRWLGSGMSQQAEVDLVSLLRETAVRERETEIKVSKSVLGR